MGALYEDVEKFFGDIFAAYGRFLARYPIVFIALSLLLSCLLGLGLVNLRYENSVEKLYTPMGSPAFKDRERLSEIFPESTGASYYFHQAVHPAPYAEVVFVPRDGGNVLKLQHMEVIRALDGRLQKITAEDDERGLNYSLLCAKRNGECVVDGDVILKSLSDNTCMKSLGKEMVVNDSTGETFDLRTSLSGISSKNNCMTAKALRLRYNLVRDTEEQRTLSLLWERRFLDSMAAYLQHRTDDSLDLAYSASASLDLELAEHLGKDTKFFSLTIIIMVLYSVFVSSGGNWVSTRTLLAQAGILAALLAILAAFGLLSMAGMVFVDICGVMPFLILGVGVDDMFILMTGWRRTNRQQTIDDRVGEMFRTSAISVTITSLTNLLAFCIGATSPFLSVKNFCIFAGVAVLFCYINHLTLFAGCMVMHARRVASSRHCVTCIPTKSRQALREDGNTRLQVFFCHGQPPQKVGDEDSYCDKLPYTSLPRLLLQWPCKLLVLLLFAVYLGVSIWGASQIKIGLKLEHVIPDSSYLAHYFQLQREHFHSYGPPVMFVVSDPVLYNKRDVQAKIHDILDKAMKSGYTDDKFSVSWLEKYLKYLTKTRKGRISNSKFISSLRDDFLKLPENRRYMNDIEFNADRTTITASRFYVRSKVLNGSLAEGDMMLSMRAFCHNTSIPVIAYSTDFIYYEHYVSILKNTLLAVGVAVIGMLFISLMFIPHAISITCVTLTMITIVLGMFGFMFFWDLELSAITNVQLILSVGFCVDFTVHISHAFMAATGKNRNERVIAALEKVGIPILNGAFSSILGVLILAFANSYVYRSFFKTMLLVILLGIFHALLLLPVLLSFIGPRRTSKPRVFIPISVNWGGAAASSYHPKHLGEENLESPAPPPPSTAGSRADLAGEDDGADVELLQLRTPDEQPELPEEDPPTSGSPLRRTLLDKSPDEEQSRLPISPQEVKLKVSSDPDTEDSNGTHHEQHRRSRSRTQSQIEREDSTSTD